MTISHKLLPSQLPMGDLEALREELERLNKEIIEANEERAQAAEYGLVVLEEKQALQIQCDELNSLYETTKRELDSASIVSNITMDVHTCTCTYR